MTTANRVPRCMRCSMSGVPVSIATDSAESTKSVKK